MLSTVPNVSVMLAASVVQRFQNTPIRNTAAIGGAMKLSTDWNTLNRSIPLMPSTATVMTIDTKAPRTVTTRPVLRISSGDAFGRMFFT